MDYKFIIILVSILLIVVFVYKEIRSLKQDVTGNIAAKLIEMKNESAAYVAKLNKDIVKCVEDVKAISSNNIVQLRELMFLNSQPITTINHYTEADGYDNGDKLGYLSDRSPDQKHMPETTYSPRVTTTVSQSPKTTTQTTLTNPNNPINQNNPINPDQTINLDTTQRQKDDVYYLSPHTSHGSSSKKLTRDTITSDEDDGDEETDEGNDNNNGDNNGHNAAMSDDIPLYVGEPGDDDSYYTDDVTEEPVKPPVIDFTTKNDSLIEDPDTEPENAHIIIKRDPKNGNTVEVDLFGIMTSQPNDLMRNSVIVNDNSDTETDTCTDSNEIYVKSSGTSVNTESSTESDSIIISNPIRDIIKQSGISKEDTSGTDSDNDNEAEESEPTKVEVVTVTQPVTVTVTKTTNASNITKPDAAAKVTKPATKSTAAKVTKRATKSSASKAKVSRSTAASNTAKMVAATSNTIEPLKPLESYSAIQLRNIASSINFSIIYTDTNGQKKVYRKDELYNQLLTIMTK